MKKFIFELMQGLSKYDSAKEYKTLQKINTSKKIKDFQKEKLEELLLFAYENTNYYKKVFDKIGIIEDGEVDFSKFDKIPILTKDIIRKEFKNLRAKCFKEKWFYNSSGGSTGEPVKFVQDYNYKSWGAATMRNYYKKYIGVDVYNDKKVILWASERDLLTGSVGPRAKFMNWLQNTKLLNTFTVSPKKLRSYIKVINEFRPVYVRGYASSVYEISKFAEKSNIKMFKPKAVITSAEVLTPKMRKVIEKVFRTKVYDFYGSREVSVMAAECKCGHMHTFPYINKVELVKSPGGDKVIVTNLHNLAMPLIRFEIGDFAIENKSKCHFSYLSPSFKRVIGRVTEVLKKKDGSVISGPSLTLTFNQKAWVKNFQIYQESYDKIVLYIVKNGKEQKDDMKAVEHKLKLILGSKIKIEWKFVRSIPKTKSGKHLYIRSGI